MTKVESEPDMPATHGRDTRRAARELLAFPGASSLLVSGTAIACIVAAAAIAWLPPYPELSSAGRAALFILMSGAALWITEAIPVFAVSLVVIGLEIAILGRPGGVFATTSQDWELFVRPGRAHCSGSSSAEWCSHRGPPGRGSTSTSPPASSRRSAARGARSCSD